MLLSGNHVITLFIYLFCLQLLALVGDQLDDAENICGAVLSVRINEDIISVWNRNASDHQVRKLFSRRFPFFCLVILIQCHVFL